MTLYKRIVNILVFVGLTAPTFARTPIRDLENGIDAISGIRRNGEQIKDKVWQGIKKGNAQNCAQILSHGNADSKQPFNINLRVTAQGNEREIMVKSILASACGTDQTFSDLYKFTSTQVRNQDYLRHMAAVYLTFQVARTLHEMVELQSPYIPNLYQTFRSANYWNQHFSKIRDNQVLSLRTHIISFINQDLLDAIITNNFAGLYAELNKGCLDVSKQWVVRRNVTFEETEFVKGAFEMNCPQAVVNIHKVGRETYLSEEVRDSDLADFKTVTTSVAKAVKERRTSIAYSDILPQLSIFAAVNTNPLMLKRKVKQGKTYPVLAYAESASQKNAIPAQKAKAIIQDFHESFGSTYRDQEIYRYIDEKIPAPRRNVYKNRVAYFFRLDMDLKKIVLEDDQVLVQFEGYEDGTGLWKLKPIKTGKTIQENISAFTAAYLKGKCVSSSGWNLIRDKRCYKIDASYCAANGLLIKGTLGKSETLKINDFFIAKIAKLSKAAKIASKANKGENILGYLKSDSLFFKKKPEEFLSIKKRGEQFFDYLSNTKVYDYGVYPNLYASKLYMMQFTITNPSRIISPEHYNITK